MRPHTTRKEFITKTAKAGAGLYFATYLKSEKVSSRFSVGFQQTPLPYGYSALQDAIDPTTMEIHYSKHAAAYAANLQAAAKKENIDTSKPLETVLANVSRYTTTLRNNGGGHYNHEIFWRMMSPRPTRPGAGLSAAIVNSFGSFEAMQNQFNEAAKSRFGSGWAWVVVDKDKKMKILSTPNQDNPLMDVTEVRGFPVLGLDVWEHAYYLKYQNRRPEYIANWWKIVNWDYVQERFQAQL